MLNKFYNLALVAICATLDLAIVKAESVQAARFQFFLNSDVGGELYFENSNLTGIGVEQASLSQLRSLNEDNFYFETSSIYIFPPLSSFATNFPEYYNINLANGDPIFTFNSGELQGIEYSESKSFYDEYIDINSAPPGGYSSSYGNISFSLLSDQYEANISGVAYSKSSIGYPVYVYNEFGEVIDVIYYYGLEIEEFSKSEEGTISFLTIEPVEAIPEPLTLLGAGTAISFGVFFKRQLARRAKI